MSLFILALFVLFYSWSLLTLGPTTWPSSYLKYAMNVTPLRGKPDSNDVKTARFFLFFSFVFRGRVSL